MSCVEVAPEHVLHAVGAIEDTHTESCGHLFQGVEEHLFPLDVDVPTLLQEVLVLQHLFA